MPRFMLGTTRVPHRKNTAGIQAVRIPAPATVTLPMSQHIGAPAEPTVKVGDAVYVGTKVGEAQGFVSSPVYSSVSGKVKKIEPYLSSNGRSCHAVVIESDGQMTPDPSIAPPVITTLDEFICAVRESGVVGLGGAGFPTAVKLEAEKKGIIKKIIINGAECEPYITSDTLTMTVDSAYVKKGVETLMSFISADETVIGIESNKPRCIDEMRRVFEGNGKVRVEALPSTYPQGAEKILIYNTTGRVVSEGGLPSDVGCLVMNVTTVAFIAKYLETGMPLVEKCITVDGSAIKNPMNVIAPIGTSIEEIIQFTGGYRADPAKVLYGGPMMGVAVYSTDYPIMKNTNAIVALSEKEAKPKEQHNCIHCGRCVSACPIGLNPTLFARAMKVGDSSERADRLTEAKIGLCIECGCCSFVCPSARPLVETNRLAKADLRNQQAKK
ncbi:MAG: electron transport complex subunit RsxC [Clostridia bacterium]|nr:electron transport complex subunit RsxC [Clostridia bacterium]